MRVSEEFQCSVLSYETKRKMETMFRAKFSILYFAKRLFESFWLFAYGLETSAVHLIFDFRTNRKQQIKSDVAIIPEENFFPQASVLEPLLFKVRL